MEYVEKIIHRFTNPYISDEVVRVARSPIRKLGRNDRLISPAAQYLKYFGQAPENLVKGIASALLYDFQQDEEAIKVQKKIQQDGVKAAIYEFCELKDNDPLVSHILDQVACFRK
jgi:mannitol-1-phosphate 5-dehydrogenase